jgi:hypothetical protein
VHKATFTAFATWRTEAAAVMQPLSEQRIVTTGRSSDEALRAARCPAPQARAC